MSNPGLYKGFVKFGTLAHKVLLQTRDAGSISYQAIVDDIGVSPNAAGMVLTRLRRNGFLFCIGRTPPQYGKRVEWVYGLTRGRRPLELAEVAAETSTQRSRRLRQRKRMAVASVFDWRGPIQPRLPQVDSARK